MGRGVLVNNWEKLSFEEEKGSGDALSKLNRLEMKRVVWQCGRFTRENYGCEDEKQFLGMSFMGWT